MFRQSYFITLHITKDDIAEYIKSHKPVKYDSADLSTTSATNVISTSTSMSAQGANDTDIVNKPYDFAWAMNDIAFSKDITHCWNCSYPYCKNESIGIPKDYQNGQFCCYGNFCSFECAARYLYDHLYNRDQTYWNQLSLLNNLYRKVYNFNNAHVIRMAPPKEVLQYFGGTIDYPEYRHCVDLHKSIQFYQLPLCPVEVYIKSFDN